MRLGGADTAWSLSCCRIDAKQQTGRKFEARGGRLARQFVSGANGPLLIAIGRSPGAPVMLVSYVVVNKVIPAIVRCRLPFLAGGSAAVGRYTSPPRYIFPWSKIANTPPAVTTQLTRYAGGRPDGLRKSQPLAGVPGGQERPLHLWQLNFGQ